MSMCTPSFQNGTEPTLWMSTLNGINTYRCKCRPYSTFTKLEHLYKEKKFCDVVLIAGIDATKVSAHKLVLAASSAYFSTMFGGTMREAYAKEVTIGEIKGTILRKIVDFIYSGSIDLCKETIESILHAGDFFQLDDLVAACCDYMLLQLNISNCLCTAVLAELHRCREVYEKSMELVSSNFEEVCAGVDFLELSDEQLGRLLSCDELSVYSEEKVFLGLVAWLEHAEGREKSLLQLLSHIRFNLLNPRFILVNSNSVCKSLECEQLISKWIEWHKEPSTSNTTPRRSNDKLALVSSFSMKIQIYNRTTDEWFHIDIPRQIKCGGFHHTWLYAHHKLIVAGGGDKEVGTKTVAYLDLQKMDWTYLPPMRLSRCLCTLAELNGQLYVIGGEVQYKWNQGKFGPQAEKFNFRTDKWQTIASLPSRISSSVLVAALDGVLYAMCVETCAFECYNPLTNKWSPRAIKTEKATQFGMAAVGQYLYTLGGYYNKERSKTLERYDPSTDTWTVVSQTNIGRTDIKCTALHNRLIACGGHDGKDHANIVEEYNPDTGEWKKLARVPFFWNYSCVPVVIKDRSVE